MMATRLTKLTRFRTAQWVARPTFLLVALGILAITQVYFAMASFTMLYVGIIGNTFAIKHIFAQFFYASVMGAAFGGLVSIGPTMTQELWGTRYFGSNVAVTF